jgi:hypothetical protein
VTFLITVLVIGVIASTTPAMVRGFRQLGRRVELLPDAADMARLDDDGGWQTMRRRLP